jgi:hypothetical protein
MWNLTSNAASRTKELLQKERSGGDEQRITPTQQMAVDGPARWSKQAREAARAWYSLTRPAVGCRLTPARGRPSGGAFHDHARDPQSKQALAGLLQEFRDECRAGNRRVCALASQVPVFSTRPAQTQQACARGDQQACQVAAQAQQLLALLLEQAA